jgi:membrane-associated protein
VSGLTDQLLTGLLNYGNPLLGGFLFLAALGVPLPATMLLMAAGAFTRQGVLGIEGAATAAVLGAIAGDGCSYLIGRYGAKLLPGRWRTETGLSRVSNLFIRWGGWSVFLTRFLLTPIALPVNLLAGSTRYPWHRFMGAVMLGEVTWVLLFGGLGHYFAAQWESIGQITGDVVGMLVGVVLVVLGVGAFLLRSGKRRAKF